jgi:hypothetical protein
MPQDTDRDIDAIIKASGYEQHGTTFQGGMFAECTCPKAPCGGVASAAEREDCLHHRKTPTQLWHWAAECPGAR